MASSKKNHNTVKTVMTSKERMLAALNRQETDHAPCSFMLFNGLRDACHDYIEFLTRQLEMGLDVYAQIPPRPPAWTSDHLNLHGLPVPHDPRVRIEERKERVPGEDLPILIKEYHTPAGTLRAEVRQTDDWPWGDHVPFLDDYISPRSRRFLVGGPADVEPLRYLLADLPAAAIAAFQREAQPIIAFARQHGLLLVGGWGVGADLLGWVQGFENMMLTTYDNPTLLRDLLSVVDAWNRRRMLVVLDAGVDLYIKRAWYENLDFWTPASWREFIFPILKADADLAHQRGARFGYIITEQCMPLLDDIAAAGVDVVIGVDPRAWDLPGAKRRLHGKVCLWGGVNGHLTVEQGTPEEVREETRTAVSVLAPGGGFVLSPVDNVRQMTPRAKANVAVLLDEWRRLSAA